MLIPSPDITNVNRTAEARKANVEAYINMFPEADRDYWPDPERIDAILDGRMYFYPANNLLYLLER